MSDKEAQDSKDQMRENQFFKTGEIVLIEHLETGTILTVSEKKLMRFFKEKNCKILYAQDEQ